MGPHGYETYTTAQREALNITLEKRREEELKEFSEQFTKFDEKYFLAVELWEKLFDYRMNKYL